ncbi:MAG: PEP-CTERM sorting domain-containing protein [Planctomycetales bacterium]|nr:PEP-CTERM sorting domain-containing protein [Planctomycetales bacterium]
MMRFLGKICAHSLLCAAALGLAAAAAHAGDYYTTVPHLATVKIGTDGTGATPVETVFGKEYSHTNWTIAPDPTIDNNSDHDAFGVPIPLQVVSWDGIPDPRGAGNSGSTNGFNYGVPGFNYREGQVDALANHQDFLFRQITRNEATLLFSLTSDSAGAAVGGIVPKAHVHWEAPVGTDGIWAPIETPAGPGAGVNHHTPVFDVDALEVWGPEPPTHNNADDPGDHGYVGGVNTADADRFSLDGDALSGVSVWDYDITTKSVTVWISHATIVDAVEDLFLGVGLDYPVDIRDRIDVDATMAHDVGVVGRWDDGDELLFSIDPITPAGIDGGEIMHLVNVGGTGVNSFLVHGGHKWDTAFDVAGTFGYAFEDIDALEAVGTLDGGGGDVNTPEPTTVALILLGLPLAAAWRRRV